MEDLKTHISTVLARWKGKHFYVACSGGLDSTVLLHLVHSMNVPLTALHVNYHLRDEESNLDEEHLRKFCIDHHIPIKVKDVEPNSIGSNLQAKAREIRYAWFEEIIQNDPDGYLLFAHHREDQVETFMLNLLRRSGVMGLSAMASVNGKYLRPLLSYSKNELRNYAISNQIEWREDRSNQSIKYKRNLLRNVVLPQINEAIPSFEESVMILIDQFQEKQKILADAIKPISAHWLSNRDLSVNEWNKLTEVEKCELLRQMDLQLPLIERLNELSESIKGKYIHTFSNSSTELTIVREENSLRLVTNKPDCPSFVIQNNRNASLPDQFDKNTIYLDSEKVEGYLHFRPWVIGDRMAPLGMKGTKLISDIIAEAKVPFDEKEHILVLCDDDHIHWCVGLKVGRHAVADSNSTSIISYSIVPGSPK